MRSATHPSRYVTVGMIALLLTTIVGLGSHGGAITALAQTAAPTMGASDLAGMCPAGAGGKAAPAFPSAPVNLQIIDVAGQLQLTQAIIDNYKKANPDKVANVEYLKATAPELPGKIKAQQDAGKVDISLVLSGYDGISAGVAQNLWVKIFPDYCSKFPNLDANYQDPARQYNNLAQGYAVTVVYTPSGPLFEYDPSQVQTPPKTLDELKAWIKANPNKFLYARPANSGPGRTFLQALPYLLGDKDPKDPINGWDKTWAFLKEIDPSIEYYPAGTSVTMNELAQGTRAIIASTMGWDINPRVLGNVPKDVKTFAVEGSTWVADAQFVAVPKGLSDDQMAVVLDLMGFMLKPEQQALTYDKGYFYPGPAVKGADLSMASAESQASLKEFGRPEYDDMIKSIKVVLPLDAKGLVAAFDKWDKEIGGAKIKK
jgi:putative spermidine/putrescine transport system substrate-binding protein